MNAQPYANDARPEAPPLIGNIEAEAALLGGMMQANPSIDRVADILTAEDFAEPLHGRIFSAIVKEQSLRPGLVTPITLKPYFDADEGMKEVGGVGYLAQLTGSSASVVGISGFAEQVAELATRRRFVERLHQTLAQAQDYDTSNDALAADLEVALVEATRKSEDGATELSAGDCVMAAVKGIERREPGVQCGHGAIDDALGPIYRKDLAILAARPAMGKTATAISYGVGAARKGHGVLFVSLEMSAEQIGQRMACDMAFDNPACPVPYGHVTEGTVNAAEIRQLVQAQEEAAELPFQVIDAGNLSVHRLARMVRRWKRRFAARGHSLDLVVVDYLQKLRAPGLANRFEIITEISQTLKEIAKDNDLGVMALAQLSRKVEEREDKRPTLADLRESGQIEQDADVVMFLFRREYYLERAEPPTFKEAEHADWQASLDAVRGEIDFICAKRRKGRAGSTKGRFYGAYQAVRGAYE